ncbi:MAG: sensor domain-containing diguanylate cyclase [Acidimicrobiales bacterium]
MPSDKQLSDVLSEFARTMLTDFPIQAILEHLVLRIVGVLPVTAAGVTLISPGSDPRYVAASNAEALLFEQLQTDLGEGPCVMAFQIGEAVSVPDLLEDARFPRFGPRALAAGLAAVFTFPLRHGEGQLGALDLYRATPGPLDADAMSAAQTLADVAAAYLLNARARDDLQHLADRSRESALHDPLTGLANRTLLVERLDHGLRRRRRTDSMMVILFVDLDQFKLVNDAHGHLVGDELLSAVGNRLTGVVRAGDTVARLAGDEFVILCEDVTAGPEGVEAIAARVGATFSRPFDLSTVEVDARASIGVALAGRADHSPEELLHQADMAMYHAKRDGGARYRIVGAEQVLALAPSASLVWNNPVPVPATPPPHQRRLAVAEGAHIDALEAQLATERDRTRMLTAHLQNLADNDPLTGLLNRRSLEHELEEHLMRCSRYGPEGAFLMVGLDGLGDIAHALGQARSDEVLAALTEVVVQRLRTTDSVGRWSPVELAVLLPSGPLEGVAVVTDSLTEIVSAACTTRVARGSLTASIGVAPVIGRASESGEMVARATESMIAARRRRQQGPVAVTG